MYRPLPAMKTAAEVEERLKQVLTGASWLLRAPNPLKNTAAQRRDMDWFDWDRPTSDHVKFQF